VTRRYFSFARFFLRGYLASRKPKRDGGGLVRELRVPRDVEDEIADEPELAKLYTEVDGSSPVADAEPKSMIKSLAKSSAKSSVRFTMPCSLFGFGAGWMIVVSSGEAAVNSGESVFDSGLLWTGPTPAITDRDVSIKLLLVVDTIMRVYSLSRSSSSSLPSPSFVNALEQSSSSK
jgi:hypothetical protein